MTCIALINSRHLHDQIIDLRGDARLLPLTASPLLRSDTSLAVLFDGWALPLTLFGHFYNVVFYWEFGFFTLRDLFDLSFGEIAPEGSDCVVLDLVAVQLLEGRLDLQSPRSPCPAAQACTKPEALNRHVDDSVGLC